MSPALIAACSCFFAVLGLTAAWLNGHERTRLAGVTLFLFSGTLMVPYSLVTGQYGFVVSCSAAVLLNLRARRNVLRERAAFRNRTDAGPRPAARRDQLD